MSALAEPAQLRLVSRFFRALKIALHRREGVSDAITRDG